MNLRVLFFLNEYLGAVFYSYKGILLPGPHSLTFFPASVSLSLFLGSLNWNQWSVRTQNSVHMFISSESVINFYGLNLTRLCVYECVHSVFMGFKWSFNYFSTFAYINNEGTSFCLVIYQSVSILCNIVST